MARPRVGFLGLGRIGHDRLRAMVATDAIAVAALCDPSPETVAAAAALAPDARVAGSLDALLALGLDGVVIATPSALHAEQAIRALRAGAAVFCQKPLGRDAAETRAVVAAARAADRLLGVDLSYRHTAGMTAIAAAIRRGALGSVHAVDLVFHNAYGPDKPWFHDRALSGGGCVIDLGVHLVDLALWALDYPEVTHVAADLFAGGARLADGGGQVEDLAMATLRLATGAVVRLACSWHLHAGQDAEIAASFYGGAGGASFYNVNGSFHDFAADRYHGTAREPLARSPDAWGGRAAAAWATALAGGARFDPAADRLVTVAEVLDRIYGRG